MYIDGKQIAHMSEIIAEARPTMPLVAVYCGSKAGKRSEYVAAARTLGQELAQAGLGLVYGGACIGVMGAVADGVIAGGGETVGVIPEFLLQKEIAHQELTHLYTTDTMHTRKALMAGFASAFVVLAGGLGTLEELMEVATWRQLYQHDKPIILLNTNGFFDNLLVHLQHTVAEGFMSEQDLTRLVVCGSVKEVTEALCRSLECPCAAVVDKL